jgi:hypothetical protein
MFSFLISLVLALVVLAVLVWAVRSLLPMLGLPPEAARIINVILVLIVVLWLVAAVAGYAPLTVYPRRY